VFNSDDFLSLYDTIKQYTREFVKKFFEKNKKNFFQKKT